MFMVDRGRIWSGDFKIVDYKIRLSKREKMVKYVMIKHYFRNRIGAN